MKTTFQNRQEAGEMLARELRIFADSPDAIVLALRAPEPLEARVDRARVRARDLRLVPREVAVAPA